MNKKYQVPLLASVALLGGVSAGLVGLASAQTTTTSTSSTATTGVVQTGTAAGVHTRPIAFGSVTAITGTTITITDKMQNTTYTVDAASTIVTKDRDTAAALTDIKVGDQIAVEGTLTGTTVTATKIHLGGMMGGHGFSGGRGKGGVMGTVSAVNGTSITLTDKDGGTFTIDATSATVKANGTASTLSNVKVGDTLMVAGKITTASMTATTIEDGVPPMRTPTTSTQTTTQ